MTQIIPSKALAVLAEDVRLLEQGTLEQPPDYTQYRDDPVAFCRDVLHTSLWSKQAEIAYAVRDHYRTAARTCNSGGKTLALTAIFFRWHFGLGVYILLVVWHTRV